MLFLEQKVKHGEIASSLLSIPLFYANITGAAILFFHQKGKHGERNKSLLILYFFLLAQIKN
jgi:hypothetical protein